MANSTFLLIDLLCPKTASGISYGSQLQRMLANELRDRQVACPAVTGIRPVDKACPQCESRGPGRVARASDEL